MDKILAPIKQRIIQVVELKGVNKENFYKKLKVSASNFRSKSLFSEVGGDVIAKILSEFPEISPEWLLTGQGEMIRPELAAYAKVDQLYAGKRKVDALLEGSRKFANTGPSEVEVLAKQLEEERERLRLAHKENGVLEFKLNEAQKEIERLKNGRKDVAVGVGV